MSQICPDCKNEYKVLGKHWRYSPEHRPCLTDKQLEILKGVVMGDGTVSGRSNGNPHIACEMTSRKYLEYLDKKLGIMSQGVKFKMSAEESAKRCRDSGFRPNARAENYQDKYLWTTKSHPDIKQLSDWYKSGKKVWPDDIKLSPTLLKHWYCCDGSLEKRGSHITMSFGLSNEADNKRKIEKIFNSSSLPEPNWVDYEGNSGRVCMIRFGVDETKEMLDYMGEPIDGFDYKWGNI